MSLEKGLKITKFFSLILVFFVLFILGSKGWTKEEDPGVSYLDKNGKWWEFETWQDYVDWSVNEKEKNSKVEVEIDCGEH